MKVKGNRKAPHSFPRLIHLFQQTFGRSPLHAKISTRHQNVAEITKGGKASTLLVPNGESDIKQEILSDTLSQRAKVGRSTEQCGRVGERSLVETLQSLGEFSLPG